MNTSKSELPKLTEKERTPLVDALLEIIAWQGHKIEALEETIIKT